MLKGIPKIMSPELLKVLAQMGHGDEIVIADGNFPSESVGKNNIVIRADGHGVTELLIAILKFFPLDQYVARPISLMEVVKGDNYNPIIWNEYKEILKNYDVDENSIEYIERFSFYEKAKKAYAIIATSESAQYGNIILKKGVIKE